ncbi:uncharacterized protein L969DRAFT_90239 [Mixia osmundae IAM 14324]|uniref:Protein-L-isoaspartate O-methyltransferase n=1 Tax=Mixia osmundae (strain CBS 9802 / IAM 14324 / JCM 22182 / KY 12970) TaxID=764103 RepID=G7DZI6_MIXOS|nr:uncharacterized protein L969DRAFT_90239 [Mixia osmundae IAM 14324]KEI37166.1 hypothetical protein L969DRAFT_90239 [Mixia osmundae IAM 14324]GAA95996.1 hypothetical protein E5Q_02654 [Mixia osmundae IAM 14324]
MAWRCSGRSNGELIDNLYKNGLIQSEAIMQAMKRVDRLNYLNTSILSGSFFNPARSDADNRQRWAREAYTDSPYSIGWDATITAPHMHANALENVLPFLRPGARVLDVGSGSGYLLGIFNALVSPGGRVVGIDHIPELVDLSRENLIRDGYQTELKSDAIRLIAGDGRQGVETEGPYDVIHVGAAAPKLPQALVDQLKSPGRLFIPIGTNDQSIYQIDKDADGKVTQVKLYGVRYVPLTDRAT